MPATNAFESAMRRARPEVDTRPSRARPGEKGAVDKLPHRGDALLTLAGYATACPEARARIRAEHAPRALGGCGLAVAADLQRHLALAVAGSVDA